MTERFGLHTKPLAAGRRLPVVVCQQPELTDGTCFRPPTFFSLSLSLSLFYSRKQRDDLSGVLLAQGGRLILLPGPRSFTWPMSASSNPNDLLVFFMFSLSLSLRSVAYFISKAISHQGLSSADKSLAASSHSRHLPIVTNEDSIYKRFPIVCT